MTARRGARVAARAIEGYVVRAQDLGEADRIFVLVSAGEGRVEGVARGARRLKGGWGAAQELLSFVRVRYRERPGRELGRLERVELLEPSFGLLSTPAALQLFSHVAELARTVVQPGEGSPRLVRLIRALLEARRRPGGVAEAGSDADEESATALLGTYFDVWVARIEGFWPDLDACAACGRALEGARRVGTHAEGARCAACAARSGIATVALSAAAAAAAARIAVEPPARLLADPPPMAAGRELGRFATLLVTSHLERPLRTPAVGRRGGG